MSDARAEVLVLGAGRSGRAAAALCLREGARVVVYDRDPARLEGLPAGARPLGGPAAPALEGWARVIASPGFPLPPEAEVVPEVDLAAEHLRAPILGITGTNGKSTTTSLVGDMLFASGTAVAVGGNLGTPLCAFVGEAVEWIVAELSSFQLERAQRLRARVAGLLNLAPDHLDRHGSLEAYGRAKARLAELQERDDVLVANRDDPWARGVASRSRARVWGFSAQGPVRDGAYVDGRDLVLATEGRERLRLALRAISRAARTPIGNALAAAALAAAAGASPRAIEAALRGFAGLPHRAVRVSVCGGVCWVNDSKATNPAAAIATLESGSAPVVWLAGGRNKGLDLAPLRGALERVRAAILFGEAEGELATVIGSAVPVVRAGTLEEAVREAARRARSGDAVLLSPACASFDQFRNFEERGERFAALARALPGARPC